MLDCIAAGPGGFIGSVLLFARVGLCGGFTTFSTFSPETFELLRAGHYGMAALYAVLSAALCVLAVLLAHMLVVEP